MPAHAPELPESFADVFADLERVVVPGLTHWQSPNFFAYFPANTSGPSILGELVSAELVRCHAFCFMPTHYHLLCEFGDVSRAIHRLNRRYAVAFNARHKRRGHVFDSPFARKPIESERQARNAFAYVALNPDDPESWPYSSYPGTVGLREPFSFVDSRPLVDAFGSIAAFRELVDAKRGAKDKNSVLRTEFYSALRMTRPPSDSPTRSKPLRS